MSHHAPGLYAIRRLRQDGDVAEVIPRYADPAAAEDAASLLRALGDPTAHVELVHADEIERQLDTTQA